MSAGASCLISVDITAPSNAGSYLNITSNLTSSSGNSGTASDTLTVTAEPGFSKAFGPTSAPAGTVSSLTFTLDNSANSVGATSIDFTDNLPAGLVVATTPNAATTCTGGTLTATAGTSTISYTGGTISAGASCSVSADVTSSSPGVYNNVSSDMTSSLGNSGPASASVTFTADAPLFSKTFSETTTSIDTPVTLTFTIDNSRSNVDSLSTGFVDDMPAGLVVAPLPSAATTCTGGTIMAVAGSGSISYSGGTVPALSACTINVSVVATMADTFDNVTGNLTSSLGSGGSASATLTANPPPTFGTSFSPTIITAGQSATLLFTVDNSNSTESASALNFSLALPTGLEVASPANIVDDCGGTLIVSGNTLDYSGGTLAAGDRCNISLDVTSQNVSDSYTPAATMASTLGSSTGTMLSGALVVGAMAVPTALPTLSNWSLILLIVMIIGIVLNRRR